jgi:hypothetical protein
MEVNKKFSWKIFVSFSLFLSFLVIFISGLILYVAPAGRVSNWVNWKLFGFTKEQWQAMHTLFSYTFVVLSILHLFTYNWKTFWYYIKTKTKAGLNKKRELYTSILLFVLIFGGTYFEIPPFSSTMDLGAYLKESWEDKKDVAPIPHAELLTLEELSKQIEGVDLSQMENRLKNNHIKYENTEQTLSEIAKVNNLAPIEIYKIVTKSASEIEGKAGGGIGRKTISDFATENGKNTDSLLVILKNAGYEAKADQTLKEIADEYDIKPYDLYELIK